jgi:competence protein ComEC
MAVWRQTLKQQSPIGASPKLEALPSSLRRYGEFSGGPSRRRWRFAGRFSGCRSRPARGSSFIFTPIASHYLYADREPFLWVIAPAAVSLGVLAYLARANRIAFFLLCGFCAVFAGELSAALRTARVAAPVIDKIRIVTLQGFIEEMDFRRNGARFLLRVHSAEGLAPEQTPFRVRLSTRRAPPFEAGTYVCLKARLLPPPARAFPAAMISRATPGSRGSARSAMCWGASRS